MGLSLRGIKFGAVALILEAVVIVGMGLFGKYVHKPADGMDLYPHFQDVNVMVFVGFGFLMTFLKNYGFSAVALNLLISALCIQWSALVIGFVHHANILDGEKFEIGILGITESCFATATVLISFGAVLGKTSPVQLLVMAVCEIFFQQLNKYIAVNHLHAVDIGESMYLHMFGAYFGMAVAWVLYDRDVAQSEKEGSVYHSDMFAMIGTLFLWMYWPSFNGGFAERQSENAIINTYLSLCASTVVAFAFSAVVDKKGKFDMVHIQNSTLAGGVAVGACANMPMDPFAAMLIGSAAGMLSVLGYKYLTPLLSKLRFHDTCGVHNLHGIPAWVAAIAAAVLSTTASKSEWGDDMGIFSETVNGDFSGRTAGEQGGYQIGAAFLTFGFAMVAGGVTGVVLRLPIWNAPTGESIFNDDENWNIPEGIPSKVEMKSTDTRM